MTKIILNNKSQNYNLNVNEGFVMFLTSKLITSFIDGFTSGMKSQSIPYLLIGSAHLYWILDLEGEVHSIWGFSQAAFKNVRAMFFFEIGQDGQQILVGFRNFFRGLPNPDLTPPKVREGVFNVRPY